jgi:beta-xylosidase
VRLASANGTYPWIPDLGDGNFANPVIFADYSDPDVVRVGSDYYLVSSSFNCTPGLPVLHSCDLVNWTLVNHAVTNLPHERYDHVQYGAGVWAPAIRFHDGLFFIFFPMPDEGIFVTTAATPEGTWSLPHLVQPGKGLIDPCPIWDDDGKAYLVHAYANSRAGTKDKLRVRPMAPDASRLLGEGHVVIDNPQRHPTIEGPKFLKHNGLYYILAPAGGVETGWQVALRASHIYGPYEDRIVLEQGASAINGPHQGALVDTPNGEWWFVHFQDTGVYGRVTHLQPVTWQEGWPVIGVDQDANGIGEPVVSWLMPQRGGPIAVPATSDDFGQSVLGLQWQWNANHKDDWCSLTERPRNLRLFAQPFEGDDIALIPNILSQKFPARSFAVETALDCSALRPGEQAGLIVLGVHHAALRICRESEDAFVFHYLIDNQIASVISGKSVPNRLRVDVCAGGLCVFAYSYGPNCEITRIDTPFQATKGHWIGARIGMFCIAPVSAAPRGHADFASFEFSPPQKFDLE